MEGDIVTREDGREGASRFCLVTKLGMRIWVSEETAERVMGFLHPPKSDDGRRSRVPDFIRIREACVCQATSDIRGVYPEGIVLDDDRRRRGDWQCPRTLLWHEAGRECDCLRKVVEPELGRTVQWAGGVMVTREEATKLSSMGQDEATGELIRIREGDDPWAEWEGRRK